jgi:hypothetical protein
VLTKNSNRLSECFFFLWSEKQHFVFLTASRKTSKRFSELFENGPSFSISCNYNFWKVLYIKKQKTFSNKFIRKYRNCFKMTLFIKYYHFFIINLISTIYTSETSFARYEDLTQGPEVKFHEIKIQLFHEIELSIMRSKLDLIMRSKLGLNIWQIWSGGQHFDHEIEIA